MIRQLSETVVLPIAGIILTFVATYELIQMLIDRNNLHDVDTWMFFKWTFKTFVAVMILANTFNIALAVFDVSQHVIQQSAGIIQNGTEITPDVMDSLRTDTRSRGRGATSRPVAAILPCAAYHDCLKYRDLCHCLWPYD